MSTIMHERKVVEDGTKQAPHLQTEIYDVLGENLHLVPLKNTGDQKPITGTSGKEGQRVELNEFDLVGLMLGQSNLISIDLDCEEAQALWSYFFPSTLTHGRKSKAVSHIWFTCEDSKNHKRKGFSVAKAKTKGDHEAMLVELRCGANWNRIPPSFHKSGEKLEWSKTPLIAMSYEEAYKATGQLASACLLLRKYPNEGARHDFVLYLSGFLAKTGMLEEDALRLIEIIADEARDNEVGGRKSTVKHTYREYQKGEPVAGYMSLVEFIDTADANRLREWLGFGKYAKTAQKLELNDTVYSKRFIDLAGENVRYVKGDGWWGFSKENGLWEEGDSVAYGYAIEAAKSFENDPTYVLDDHTREALKHYSNSSQNVGKINACLSVAERHRPLGLKMDKFNPNGELLNVSNGTIDLRTGEIRDYAPEDLITKVMPVIYNPDAVAPQFLEGLSNMLRNQEMVDYVINALGASLVNYPDRRKIYFLVSGPKGGKTTLINIIRGVLGAGYHTVCSREVLLHTGNRDSGGPKHQLADLFGKRIITCEELGTSNLLDGEQIKQMTGNSYLKADKKFKDSFEFRLEGTFFVATNFCVHPKSPDDPAFWERARLIEFEPILEDKIVKGFESKILSSEKEGVLNLLIQGARRFIANNYEVPNMPESVIASTKAMEDDADSIGSFIRERVRKKLGSDIPKGWQYEQYQIYCEDVKKRCETQNALSKRLKLKGFKDKNRGTKNLNGTKTEVGRIWLDQEILDADGNAIEWGREVSSQMIMAS